MIKRIIALVLCAVALLGVLTACGSKNEKLTVICTVFPVYDWVRSVVGENENIDVRLLVSDGADLHSFQPTAKDAIAIKTADLVVRVGGNDDSFVNELVKDSMGIDLRLSEISGVTLRHTSVSSDDRHEDGEEHSHHHATDEHIWLSLKNAIVCIDEIRRSMSTIDPEGSDNYEKNAADYIEKLRSLDMAYEKAIDSVDEPRMVFADRFPFVYMTEDYGIAYEAAFEGCTTDAEAGFDTVIRLAAKTEKWGLSCVFVTECSDGRLPASVSEAVTGKEIEIAVLNSMQSVTSKDIASGQTYIGIMESNLSVLERYL